MGGSGPGPSSLDGENDVSIVGIPPDPVQLGKCEGHSDRVNPAENAGSPEKPGGTTWNGVRPMVYEREAATVFA
jgi:hypothetical protein